MERSPLQNAAAQLRETLAKRVTAGDEGPRLEAGRKIDAELRRLESGIRDQGAALEGIRNELAILSDLIRTVNEERMMQLHRSPTRKLDRGALMFLTAGLVSLALVVGAWTQGGFRIVLSQVVGFTKTMLGG